MKYNPFVMFGLALACIISIAIPVEQAVKYVQEREANSSYGEEPPYSPNSSAGPDGS